MPRLIAALLVLVLVRPDTSVGQAAPTAATLAPGVRVRITFPRADPRPAVFVANRGDTLVVRWIGFPGDDALLFANIARLEVSSGRHRNVAKGAAFGALGGGVAGVILGAVTYEPCTSMCIFGPQNRATSALAGGAVFGVLGLVGGSLVGLPRREGWTRVSLHDRRVAVALTPRPDGTRLGVSLRF